VNVEAVKPRRCRPRQEDRYDQLIAAHDPPHPRSTSPARQSLRSSAREISCAAARMPASGLRTSCAKRARRGARSRWRRELRARAQCRVNTKAQCSHSPPPARLRHWRGPGRTLGPPDATSASATPLALESARRASEDKRSVAAKYLVQPTAKQTRGRHLPSNSAAAAFTKANAFAPCRSPSPASASASSHRSASGAEERDVDSGRKDRIGHAAARS
jgi:hypothetical protein